MAIIKNQAGPGKARLLLNAAVLKKALGFIGVAVPSKAVIPALEYVLCVATDNKLTLKGSDLRNTMWVTIPTEGYKIGEDGEAFLIPYDLVNSLAGDLGNDPLYLELNDSGEDSLKVFECVLSVVQEKGKSKKYKLTGENPVDYPKDFVSKALNAQPISLTFSGDDRTKIIAALENIVSFTSTDELRQAMTGVSLSTLGNRVMLAATDGHRLKKYPVELSAELSKANVVITKKFVSILSKLNAEANEESPLQISISPTAVRASIGDHFAQSLLIDDRFPDVDNAIPSNNPFSATVDRDELLKVLKRVKLFSNKITNQIRLSFSSDNLTVSAEDVDYANDGTETIACEYDSKQGLEIGFNGKVLSESLRLLESETVRFEMSAPNRAALLYGDDPEVLTLVMPVMLNSYV